MPTNIVLGTLGALVCSLAFGSNYVPVKKYPTFDGLVFQWFQCSGILFVGLLLGIVTNKWGDFAYSGLYIGWEGFIGGGLWAVGNCLATPAIDLLGLGVAFVIWNESNVITGWVVGRFYVFGLPPEKVRYQTWNVVGLVLVICSLLLLLPIRPEQDLDMIKEATVTRATAPNRRRYHHRVSPEVDDDDEDDEYFGDPDLPPQSNSSDDSIGSPRPHHMESATTSRRTNKFEPDQSMSSTLISTHEHPRGKASVGPFVGISMKRSVQSRELRRGRTQSVEFLPAPNLVGSSSTSLLIVSADGDIGGQVIAVRDHEEYDDDMLSHANGCANFLDFNVIARELVMSRIETQNAMYRDLERKEAEKKRRRERGKKRRSYRDDDRHANDDRHHIDAANGAYHKMNVNRHYNNTTDSSYFCSPYASSARAAGVVLTIFMGVCLGNSLTPFLVWRNSRGSVHPLDFMFSQTVGIYVFSTLIFLVKGGYSHFTSGRMRQPAMRPAFISGAVWAIGFAGQLYAVTYLPFIVAYPITAVGPVLISTLWSLLFFGEIKGKRNLQFLSSSMFLILVGIAGLFMSDQ